MGKEKNEKMEENSRITRQSIMEKVNHARAKKEYKRINSLLNRKPQATSKMHQEAFSRFMEIRKKEGEAFNGPDD